MKLIDLHKEWCEAGGLPGDGLCNSVLKEDKDLLRMFEPSDADVNELWNQGMTAVYWGYGAPIEYGDYRQRWRAYTPLRQTIVLLICAMKGELK